jgi:hypothetical protein
MTINQINFITDLKSALTTEGLLNSKEWTDNMPTLTLTQDVECIINSINNGFSSTSPRTAFEERSYYSVIIGLKQTTLTVDNIESVRRTNVGKMRSAIFNVFETSTSLESGAMKSENQIVETTMFDTNAYIGYAINITCDFINSY